MKFLFNKKLPWDEIAVLEELLRYLKTCDEYDIELEYSCSSVGGIVNKFLTKRSLINPGKSYIAPMVSFLPTLHNTETTAFLLSDHMWRNFYQQYNQQDMIKRFEYFIKYGIPYRLFFPYKRNAAAWIKANKRICTNS